MFTELTSAPIPQPVRPLKTVNGIRFTDDSIGRSVSTEDYPEPFISGNISVSLRVQPSGTSGSALSMQPSGSSKAKGVHAEDVPASRGFLSSEDYSERVLAAKASASATESKNNMSTSAFEETRRVHLDDVPSHREVSNDYSEALIFRSGTDSFFSKPFLCQWFFISLALCPRFLLTIVCLLFSAINSPK